MMPQPDPDPTEEDPLVAKCVEAALAPCIDGVPPEAVGVMRAWLYHFYENNDEARALLDKIREAQKDAPKVARSGEKLRYDAAALEEAARRAVGIGKRSGR